MVIQCIEEEVLTWGRGEAWGGELGRMQGGGGMSSSSSSSGGTGNALGAGGPALVRMVRPVARPRLEARVLRPLRRGRRCFGAPQANQLSKPMCKRGQGWQSAQRAMAKLP